MTLQRFHHTTPSIEAESNPATPAFLSSPALYIVSSIGGAIHSYGDEHLVGAMGGVWAHPLRVLHGWSLSLKQGDTTIPLTNASICDLYGSHLERRYDSHGLQIVWTEFVAEEGPALAGLIALHNTTSTPWQGGLQLHAELDMRGCWFGGWDASAPHSTINGTLLTTTSESAPFAERASAITLDPPATWDVTTPAATAHITLHLAPGEQCQVRIALAVAHTGGAAAASMLAQHVCQNGEALLSQKRAHYVELFNETTLTTPDTHINQGWQLARLNMQLLTAHYPDLPPYFLAGIPEFPQLFSCDNTYTTPGACAAGFADMIRSTMAALAAYAQRACARIPHEITTNGRVYHAGNTQETPQFAVACWDYLRWTGDIGFVRDLYPLLLEGLEHFRWAIEHDAYPTGDGMVERLGMGICKLDSTCYLYQALFALQQIAGALDQPADAARFTHQAEQLRQRFERDWWIEDEEMYADSMHLNGQTQFDGHWTVAVPIQVGIASEERARRSLARIEREWVNQWGLVHTRGAEERVWTLPTGILALAACTYDHSDLGLTLLRNIASTSQHGALGMLKELIPQGICFVQLWSSGLLIQGITEGLLGLRPLAHLHRLDIAPNLPSSWPEVWLRGLPVGAHVVDLYITPTSLRVTHRSGPQPLTIGYAARETNLPVGATLG